MLKRKPRGFPTKDGRFTPADRDEDLRERGIDGEVAKRLDRDTEALLASVASLSELTTYLALDYLDRVRRPFPSLTLAAGVRLMTRAYVAHMAVEANPDAYGVGDIPVIGTLPDARRGRPPQDLLSRLVKTSRRSFPAVCAVGPNVWEGYVSCLVARTHADIAAAPDEEAGEAWPDRATVDGLARVGWLLRQTDIRYEQSPERQ